MRNVDDILAPELYYRIQPLLDEQASAMLCRWVHLLTLITAGQFQSFVSYWNAHPDALEAFVLMPASYRDHHAYPHGLLQHSLEVAEQAYQSARRLAHSATECQLVLLAGLLHDLGKIYSRCATKTPQYRPGPHECFNFALLTEPLQQLAQQDWQAHQLLCSMLAPYQHHRSEQYAVETLFRHADQASCASNRMHGLFAGKPAHYHFVRSGTQMVRRVV